MSQLNRLKELRAEAATAVRKAMIKSGHYNRDIFNNWPNVPYAGMEVTSAMQTWTALDDEIREKEMNDEGYFYIAIAFIGVIAFAAICMDMLVWRPL